MRFTMRKRRRLRRRPLVAFLLSVPNDACRLVGGSAAVLTDKCPGFVFVRRGCRHPRTSALNAVGRRGTTCSFRSNPRTEAARSTAASDGVQGRRTGRSEEHTSELQSLAYLVCRLLLEKK